MAWKYQLALQRRGDHLPASRTLALASKQLETPFGYKDVAIARVKRREGE